MLSRLMILIEFVITYRAFVILLSQEVFRDVPVVVFQSSLEITSLLKDLGAKFVVSKATTEEECREAAAVVTRCARELRERMR